MLRRRDADPKAWGAKVGKWVGDSPETGTRRWERDEFEPSVPGSRCRRSPRRSLTHRWSLSRRRVLFVRPEQALKVPKKQRPRGHQYVENARIGE
jgi:hypothetical protein